MGVTVRPMRPDEAELFLGIQRASVRGMAAQAYSQDIIDQWGVTLASFAPVTSCRVRRGGVSALRWLPKSSDSRASMA